MKEQKNLEFKESVTNTFLKTVSAFANYGTGRIKFGIRDNGDIVGISDPEKTCLDIENRINDSINPVPQYTLSINEKNSVITLEVEEGLNKPYLYKSKAYRRNDTATIEVDRLDLTRLILEGQSSSFEELPSKMEDLHFTVLEKKLKSVLHLETFSKDTLKTLELLDDRDNINIAGELLADKNSFSGTDIVRFGDSISIMLDREIHEHESVLLQYDEAVNMYRKYYQYDEIKSITRETVSLIPEDAFREAVANALVHRAWDISSDIRIGMYPEKIEIISPGGLPKGVTEEEYLRGGISVLRNRILGNIFFRLNLIERFGTGIRRINEAYHYSEKKPVFDISENSIRISLPVVNTDNIPNTLTEDENKIYRLLKGYSMASSEIAERAAFGKTKTVKILKKLVEDGYVRSNGNGRGRKYSVDLD